MAVAKSASQTGHLQSFHRAGFEALHALQNDEPDVSALMTLYAQVSRMRVVCSTSVVECADQIVKKIIATYLEPNKTFPELRKMATSGLIDPLREFSEAARAESERLNFGPPE